MIYLDNGATSFPKPKGLIVTMDECIRKYCGNPGRSGHYMSMKTGEEVYKARQKIAKVFNIETPERLVFTKNTTEAINLGLFGLLENGDHVITTVMEHNSVPRPLKRMEGKNIEHTIVKADYEGKVCIEDIKREIRKNTKMIVMTAASNVTGTKMPLQEVGTLAKQTNLLFMVDGAQGAGSMDLDVENLKIDMLAFPGHKGLLGPLGTGALYVREGIEISPFISGGTGTMSKDRRQPIEFPEGFEAGTINAPGIIGLGYTAEYVHRIGPRVIGKYEEDLIKRLEAELKNMKFIEMYGPAPEEKVGISLINIKEKGAEEVTEELSRNFGIAVRGGFHCAGLAHKTIGTWKQGAIRVSVGPFNTVSDMKALVDALWKMGKS